MGTRRKKETRKTKNNMAKDCRKEREEAGWRTWDEVRSREENRERWKSEGPMCAQARGGQVTGNTDFNILSDVTYQ